MRVIGGGGKTDYEKVSVDEWLPGHITEVQLQDRPYTRTDKDTKVETTTDEPHVRFKFALDGYKFPHYSRWMKASTYEGSNLYKMFLKFLCPLHDCKDQLIDLDKLTGAKVKLMWVNNKEYQNIAQVRGLDEELNIITHETPAESHDDEEGAPF